MRLAFEPTPGLAAMWVVTCGPAEPAGAYGADRALEASV